MLFAVFSKVISKKPVIFGSTRYFIEFWSGASCCSILNSVGMNTKIFARCLFINHCKRHLFKKSLYLDLNAEYFSRSISSCFCLTSLTSNLTSNSCTKNVSSRTPSFNTPRRFCSTKEGPPAKRLPPLMNFPEIVWPSIIKSLRNFILTTFIIRPYFDREFNIPDFIAGSKKAIEVVSSKLSEGDITALEGLVDKDAVQDLQKSISLMSLSQRQQISINKDDIYFSFPYQIGIMFDDEENVSVQKRFVEITMVYHIFRGLEAMKNRGEDLPLNVGMLPQYRENISICNYRFIREFTKGVEGEWTINLLNHFKPSDYIEQ